MTRALASGVLTEIAKPITAPAYFVELLFSSPLRLSSRETLVWSGSTWLGWDLRVDGLAVDAADSGQTGRLTIGDTDNTLAALILSEGIGDRQVNIWKFYGAAPGASDPVQVFAGVGGDAQLVPDAGHVLISLAQRGATTLFSPRRYITQAEGFNFVPAEGALLTWNGETVRLVRER